MLPRIVLFVLQLLPAWYLGERFASFIARGVAVGRGYEIVVSALVYALLVTLVGYAGSKILKGVPAPSAATLVAALVLSIALALLTLVPAVSQAIETALPALRSNRFLYPLVGAFAGYYLKH